MAASSSPRPHLDARMSAPGTSTQIDMRPTSDRARVKKASLRSRVSAQAVARRRIIPAIQFVRVLVLSATAAADVQAQRAKQLLLPAWLVESECARPTTAFVATNHKANLATIKGATGHRFAKLANVSSAAQAERFVFSIEKDHERWLGRHLCRRATQGNRVLQ